MMAREGAGECAERHRRVHGAEGGGAHFGNGFARRFCKDSDGIDVAELALIRGHAGCCVALG